MRYPITPDFLESAPEGIAKLYQDLEEAILSDICRRFRLSGEATETALEQIRILQRRGIPLEEIERRIQKTLELSQKEFDEVFQRAIDRNQAYFDGMISKADILSATVHRTALQQEAAAIQAQTRGEFTNITQSLGFALRTAGKVEFQPIAKAYQKVMDDAELQVWSGAVDYNTAVRNAIRRLSDSGLQTVDYASGWHNRADVAARRAVMTGINQLSDQYSDQISDLLGTEYFEISAHSRARDIDGPKGWENHKKWQGRVYYKSKNGESDPRGEYPDLVKSTGYGYVDGLSGANCRHKKFSFVPGVSERTYTDEELDNIDPPPFTYQGRTYTAYQATQKQRQLETSMRDCKRKMAAYKAAGLDEDYAASSSRLRMLSKEYKQFSAAAGLRTQPERARVQGFGADDTYERAAAHLKTQREAEEKIRQAIRSGEYPLEINPEKQARHMTGTEMPGRSVITVSAEELQAIINANAGSGKINFSKDFTTWKNTEIVDAGREIGYTVNKNGDIITTKSIKIHYSKSGTHAVPFSGRWKK